MRVLGLAAFLCASLFCALLAESARANRSSPSAYRYTGRPGDGTTRTCTYCHNASSVQPPRISVDGLDGLVAGRAATLTLTITSSNANPSARVAGFAVSTDGAGAFSNTSGDGVTDHCRVGNVVKHPAPASLSVRCDGNVPCPSFFDESGSASYSLVLENLQAGTFTLYVGANDANENSRSDGDRAAMLALPFTVAPNEDVEREPPVITCDGPGAGEGGAEGEGEEPPPPTDGGDEDHDAPAGCQCVSADTGLVPTIALAALALPLLRRRDRRAASSR